MTDDFETRFLTGMAALLAAETAGTWRPDLSAYAETETGIVLGALPQSPPRAIALNAYSVDDDPSLSDSVLGLQVLTRWSDQDPRNVGDLAGSVYDALHGRTHFVLAGGVHVVQALLRSATSTGPDDNSRWRRVQNFYCSVHRPSPHRQ